MASQNQKTNAHKMILNWYHIKAYRCCYPWKCTMHHEIRKPKNTSLGITCTLVFVSLSMDMHYSSQHQKQINTSDLVWQVYRCWHLWKCTMRHKIRKPIKTPDLVLQVYGCWYHWIYAKPHKITKPIKSSDFVLQVYGCWYSWYTSHKIRQTNGTHRTGYWYIKFTGLSIPLYGLYLGQDLIGLDTSSKRVLVSLNMHCTLHKSRVTMNTSECVRQVYKCW